MSNIVFSIQNPDSQPTNQACLYFGKENSLVITFTRNTGVSQLQPGDLFYIIIPSSLLAAASEDQLDSKDWKVYSIIGPSPQQASFTYVLTPTVVLDFSKPIAICLKKLHGATLGMDDVVTRYNVQGRNISGTRQKLSVLEPPDQLGDLNDVISFATFINEDQDLVEGGKVYASPVSLKPPIANSLHLNLKFSGSQMTPSWKANEVPQFTLSFSYGGDSIALTNALKPKDPGYDELTSAWNIQSAVDSDENNLWQILPLNTDHNGPNWIIQPTTSNQSLFSSNQPNLDLYFTHIISVLPKGHPTIYIQWNHIPGYNDGVRALDIERAVPSTAKLELKSQDDQRTIAPGQNIVLNWRVFNAGTLAMSWDEGLRTREVPAFDSSKPALFYSGSDDSIIPDSPENEIHLFANGDQGQSSNPISVQVSPFPPPAIKTFTGVAQLGEDGAVEVTLEWLVSNLGNEGKFVLNGQEMDGSKYNGLKYTTITKVTDPLFAKNFILLAVDQVNGLQSSASITVTLSSIVNFVGAVERDASNNPSLVLHWQVLNLVPNTAYLINGVPCSGVDAKGQGSISIPLSATTPLQRSYTLTMQVPGQAAITKTLNTQFVEKNVIKSKPDGTSFPLHLVLSQDGKTAFALFSSPSADHFYLTQFNPHKDDPIAFSQSYSIKGVCYMSYSSSLALSPDSTQLFISSNAVICVAYKNGNFASQMLIASNIKNVYFISYRSIFMPDMSNVFMAITSDVECCTPDPASYAPFGSPNPNLSFFGTYNFIANLWALGLSANGARIFAADNLFSHIWWKDLADEGLMTQFTPVPQSLECFVVSKNNWAYLIVGNYDDDSCYVTTLDVGSTDYDKRYTARVGDKFSSHMNVEVSMDFSFLVISNRGSNCIYLTSGATAQQPLVVPLQTLTIQDPGTPIMTQDNTRIFVPGVEGIHVLEPVFV